MNFKESEAYFFDKNNSFGVKNYVFDFFNAAHIAKLAQLILHVDFYTQSELKIHQVESKPLNVIEF